MSMDILKRMQKANISSSEVPLLGLDIGGVTVKIAYFDVQINNLQLDVLKNANYLEDEQIENRKIINNFFNSNLKDYIVNENVNSEVKLKNITGKLRLYLFTRQFFGETFLKKLIELNLKQPFICVTGAALVNYMQVLVNDLKARVLLLSSENEAIVRGVKLLQTQKVSPFHQIQYDVDNKSELVYSIELLNENFYPSTIAVVGTSTTMLRLNSSNNYTFLNQSAISGQTFLGLCNTANKLMNGNNSTLSYEECLKLASTGSNEELDVTVKKLCGGSDNKVEQFLYLHNLETGLYVRKDDFIQQFGDLSISCFGDNNKDKKISINNFAAASMNLVCYQIAELLCLYSRLNPNNKHMICAGSFLVNNLKAKYLISKYVHILNRGKKNTQEVYFIDNESCLAALGCLAVDAQNCQVEAQE